jgi:hypothetical protein
MADKPTQQPAKPTTKTTTTTTRTTSTPGVIKRGLGGSPKPPTKTPKLPG